jgi:anion-transporting  ArsA/GET3 family ATPase
MGTPLAGSHPLKRALEEKRVLISVGSGGVGKTTVAASIALCAALEGYKSLVCTIDPARRLASSLGLAELGNSESGMSAEKLEAAGLPTSTPLFAMMLDMKQTWDEFVEQHAPPNRKERILTNRFYQSLSSVLAGSQEYIAMEKLWQLRMHRDYRLIVLDTPPTAHALDFLDAPNRVLDLFDNDAAQWLLAPALTVGKFGLSLFNIGGGYIAKTLAKLTGAETLQELADFMLAMGSLSESFRQRARQVREILKSPETAFVLVTQPSRERLEEAVHFHATLKQNDMAIAAVVVNRVSPRPTDGDWDAARQLPAPLRTKVEATLQEAHIAALQEASAMTELEGRCQPTPLVPLPRLSQDVHDLSGLRELGESLLGG